MTAPLKASASARASNQELAFIAASWGGAHRLFVSMTGDLDDFEVNRIRVYFN